ncbi:hypothetical protein FBU30_001914 [Linnemannia zychae]|nr:hypothetical protein FBU30_001914 [Linnemannia zychae]
MTASHVSTFSSEGSQQFILRTLTPSFLLKYIPTAQDVMLVIAFLAAIFWKLNIPHLIPSIPHISHAVSNGLSLTATLMDKVAAVLEAICRTLFGLGSEATKGFLQNFHLHWDNAVGALNQMRSPESQQVVYKSDINNIVVGLIAAENRLESQASLIADQRIRLDGHDEAIADLRATHDKAMVDMRNDFIAYMDSRYPA